MSEIAEWKQKYRDALVEAEADEKRWRQIEQALRRLVGRLCAAGMGVDPKLDDELIALAAANRRNADALELEKLAGSLTTAVVAVDAVSPVPTVVLGMASKSSRWDATCAAVTGMLQLLKLGEPDSVTIDALIARVPQSKADPELGAIVTQAADMIETQRDVFSRERLQSTAVLADVTQRLGEMAGYLSETNQANESRFNDSESTNASVISQVRSISAEIHGATDLDTLQAAVTARLESVTQQVLDFRLREESRSVEFVGRAERMRSRIADLELETSTLRTDLAREKYGARHDPLTRLANRKSFEERFAEELQRSAESGAPMTLLLWDLDDFKVVNDSFGHRAGDRVLQTVANCFKAALPATDLVARIGGEEFVMLLANTAVAPALLLADQVRTTIGNLRLHFRSTPVRVTVSCGLTDLRREDGSNAAFDRADAALYRAKHGGKNLCIVN